MFVVSSIVCLVRFHKQLREFRRSDVGWVQKWIEYLIVALIFFNDPFCGISEHLGPVYNVLQTFFESGFIAMLMFFWLLLIHAVAQQENVISID